ncbi:MAG: glycosyltransferase, partial [Gemmatimonadetes bacterium]|nr:glycosyltransferase [Gemmatimonadota bacterium]
PGLAERDELDGIPIHRFRYAPSGMETLAYTGTMVEAVNASIGGKMALAGMLAAGARAVSRLRRELRPAVVHAHWWFPGGLQARGTAGKAPFVVTMHGSDVRLAANSGPGRSLMRRVLEGADALTAVSSWLAQQAAAIAPGIYCDVAPMPVDVHAFEPAADGERRARHVLFVGRLSLQKGILEALHAIAATGPDTTAEIVGGGPLEAEAMAHAERLGLVGRVVFHGGLSPSALPPLYRAATTVVMPSHEEGLGLVAVEAALSETPVVAYRSGGLPDVVRDGETGRLVAPGHEVELGTTLRAVLDDAALARRLGTRARREALERFAPAAVAQKYATVYHEAIATHGRRRG